MGGALSRFDRGDIERAVMLQRKSYRLLHWAVDGIDRGFVDTRDVRHVATLHEAALTWIEARFEVLPSDTRPERADVAPFANLFASYLDASFELVDRPGTQLHSHHDFCPICSWLVDMPRLRPKKLRRGDKERARDLMRTWGAEVALALGVPEDPKVLDDPALQEDLAYGAYAKDLLNRLRGFSEGPASLALWRRFAWEPTGSPKKGFELTTDRILEAEARVTAALDPSGAATGVPRRWGGQWGVVRR